MKVPPAANDSKILSMRYLVGTDKHQSLQLDPRNVMVLSRRGYALEARVNQHSCAVLLYRKPFHYLSEGAHMVFSTRHPASSFSWNKEYNPAEDSTVQEAEQLRRRDFISIQLPRGRITNVYNDEA